MKNLEELRMNTSSKYLISFKVKLVYGTSQSIAKEALFGMPSTAVLTIAWTKKMLSNAFHKSARESRSYTTIELLIEILSPKIFCYKQSTFLINPSLSSNWPILGSVPRKLLWRLLLAPRNILLPNRRGFIIIQTQSMFGR